MTIDEFARNAPPKTTERLTLENRALRRLAEQLRDRLAKLAGQLGSIDRDPLTGLGTRRVFHRRLAEELDRVARTPGQGLALLVADVLELRVINEHYGCLAGDATLRWVAGFLEDNCRFHDVTCRIGGGEFMVLLTNGDSDTAPRLLERLREQLLAANELLPIPLGLAIGRATHDPRSRPTARQLFEDARASLRLDRRRQRQSLPPVGDRPRAAAQ